MRFLATAYLMFLVELLVCVPNSMQAQSISLVRGTITGPDGRPPKMGNVSIEKAMSFRDQLKSEIAADGTFEMRVKGTGSFHLRASGVDLQSDEWIFLLLNADTLHAAIRLSGIKADTTIRSISLIGDFNAFNFETAVPLNKLPDGRYGIDMPTDSSVFRYQILGVTADQRSINGQQGDAYSYDGGGDYISMITPTNGVARIIYDPSLLRRDSRPAEIRWGDKYNTIITHYRSISDSLQRFWTEGTTRACPTPNVKSAPLDVTSISRSAEMQIRTEQDSTATLLLKYYFILSQGMGWNTPKDKALVRDFLHAVRPNPALWSLMVDDLPMLFTWAGDSTTWANQADAFLAADQTSENNPYLIAGMLRVFQEFQDTGALRSYYRRFLATYPDHPLADPVRQHFNPDPKIVKGKKVPSFNVPALFHAAESVTQNTFHGKTVLYHFWSSSVPGPLEAMQRVFKKYHAKGFEIVSIAFTNSADATIKYIRESTYTSWKYAYILFGSSNPIIEDYELHLVPRMILADRSGTIVALNDDLTADLLEMEIAAAMRRR